MHCSHLTHSTNTCKLQGGARPKATTRAPTKAAVTQAAESPAAAQGVHYYKAVFDAKEPGFESGTPKRSMALWLDICSRYPFHLNGKNQGP